MLKSLLSLSFGTALGTQACLRVMHHRQPYPLPHQLSTWLDHPVRMSYREPSATLALFGFGAGMSVVDLGCGTATFTCEMARMVGETGVVHAVDIQQPMLQKAQARVKSVGCDNNVQFHCAGVYQLPLPDHSVDLVVAISTLTEVPDRFRALTEVRRILKPGGRLAISEELLATSFVPASLVRHWVEEAGFRFGALTWNPIHYSIICFNDAIST
ncbi:MAG: methyltransferase domain-containing protein [Chloroflexota bacterium]